LWEGVSACAPQQVNVTIPKGYDNPNRGPRTCADDPARVAGWRESGCATLGNVLSRRRIVVVLCVSATIVGGCGDDGTVASDAGRFCGEASTQRDLIVAPPLSTQAEVDETLDFYRLMGQLAPIAIATEWNDVVAAMETASTLVPGDPASEQRVAVAAYASERSAYAVKVWLQRNCGVDIPITTIAPQDFVPAKTVTVPPAPRSVPPTTVPAG
jgi:hypothetical protein